MVNHKRQSIYTDLDDYIKRQTCNRLRRMKKKSSCRKRGAYDDVLRGSGSSCGPSGRLGLGGCGDCDGGLCETKTTNRMRTTRRRPWMREKQIENTGSLACFCTFAEPNTGNTNVVPRQHKTLPFSPLKQKAH